MQWILNLNRTSENTYTGYTGSRASPFAVGATIAVHIAIGGLVWMLPPGTIKKITPPIIWVHFEKAPPQKEEPRLERKKENPLQRKVETRQETMLETTTLTETRTTEDVLGGGDGGGSTLTDDTKPIHEPVLVSAVPDPKRLRDFQPPYPPAMIRAQMEGFATVRVFINAEGRVVSVELVDTSDSAFWKATQQQALKSWRFRPATRDGEPVASERVMTVRFRLADL